MPSRTLADNPSRKEALQLLQTTWYERASGFLSALLLLVGSMTLLLVVIWLSGSWHYDWGRTRTAVRIHRDAGSEGGSGTTPSLHPAELDVQDEPALSTEPPVELALSSVSSIVERELTLLDGLGGSKSLGDVDGRKNGPGTTKGPGGPGDIDAIPPWERWEVRFEAGDLAEYARVLDFFGIELGVAGGGEPQVDYCRALSQPMPVIRSAKPEEEKRLRFLYRSGPLRQADRTLAEKAGIRTEGRVVFQFYSPELYAQLLALEGERLGGRPLGDVRRTVFAVRSAKGRYEFYVRTVEWGKGSGSGLAPL